MPIDRGSHISAIIEEVKHFKPNSILDVGIGFGMMGAIFRAYTDIRMAEIDSSRYHVWKTIIEGIEVWEGYRNPLWDVYSHVFIGTAQELLPKFSSSYDLIYCGDMIEHLTKEEGHDLIKLMLAHAKTLIIATPSPAPAQGELMGNHYEEHKSSWDESDFSGYKHEVIGNFGGILCVRLT